MPNSHRKASDKNDAADTGAIGRGIVIEPINKPNLHYLQGNDNLPEQSFQERCVYHCKYPATKVQTTVEMAEVIPGKGKQLVTRFTYYDDQNHPCKEARLWLPGDPYDHGLGYHQTSPLQNPSAAPERTGHGSDAAKTVMITSYGITDENGPAMVATGLKPMSAADFLNNIILTTDLEATYQGLVHMLDGASKALGSKFGDQIEAGAGNDKVFGMDGDDAVYKWQAGDLAFDGGAGIDTLAFKAENGSRFPVAPTEQLVIDLAKGTGQNPYGGKLTVNHVENVIGTDNADIITGDGKANVIGDGIVECDGDVINSAGGNDRIGFFSFAGVILGTEGAKIDGGKGVDTLTFSNDHEDGDRIDLSNQNNNDGMFLGTKFTNIEHFKVSGPFSTSFSSLDFVGDDKANYLQVAQGILNVQMAGGNDTLVFSSSTTSDPVSVDGGQGNDRLLLTSAFGVNILDLAHEANNTGAFANATVTGFETIHMAKAVFGQLDFRGDDNANIAIGAKLDDTLSGGDGDDRFSGLGGKDSLTGGGDADTFVFTSAKDSTVAAAGQDLITDFHHSQHDRIDLSGIDAATGGAHDQAFKFINEVHFHGKAGELNYRVHKGDAYVSGDVNGDGKADFTIHLTGVTHLEKSDFAL
jgi:Ca2+-binding RTX toxin-like protein